MPIYTGGKKNTFEEKALIKMWLPDDIRCSCKVVKSYFWGKNGGHQKWIKLIVADSSTNCSIKVATSAASLVFYLRHSCFLHEIHSRVCLFSTIQCESSSKWSILICCNANFKVAPSVPSVHFHGCYILSHNYDFLCHNFHFMSLLWLSMSFVFKSRLRSSSFFFLILW